MIIKLIVEPRADCSRAAIPQIAYLDLGVNSDLPRARGLFPNARRAVMYPPTDLANKPLPQSESDLRRIARELCPCDVVFADIEAGTPDERVRAVIGICEQLSDEFCHQTHAAAKTISAAGAA